MCADTSFRFHAVLLHQLDQSYMYHYTRNAYEFHSAPSDMSPDERQDCLSVFREHGISSIQAVQAYKHQGSELLHLRLLSLS